ncbi:MAG: thioredoxin family protein [Candidatus Nanohaloarchaea archaeon]|nr:thioredoxin family protein [Candidatus Nanohaloarchaea archaeon]
MTDVTIEVFYSATCPNCPPQKELAQRFEDRDDVTVRLTDVAKHQERAQNHGVSAVPTTVVTGPGVDQKLGFRGVMQATTLQDAVDVARGKLAPDELETPSLLGRVKEKLF